MYRGSAYSIESQKDPEPKGSPIEKSYQIALIGDAGVGKSSILSQFLDSSFLEEIQSTQGIDMRFKKLIIGEYLVKLRIWDTSGEDILKSIMEGYLKNIDAVMLIFDVTDEVSYENIIIWDGEIAKQYIGKANKLSKVLVGNKADLPHRKEMTINAKRYAERQKIVYFQTSAKQNHLILDSFVYLVKDLLNEKQILRTSRTIHLEDEVNTCRCDLSKCIR